MNNGNIKIGIFGGSGYGGSELLRILLFHPKAEISFVTANEHAGKAVGDVHRNLAGLTDLRFIPSSETAEQLSDLDCVFLALPHGQAMDLVPSLPTNVKAIDLSGDFRLSDQAAFEKHYKQQHTAMRLAVRIRLWFDRDKSGRHSKRSPDREPRLLCDGHSAGSCSARRK